MPWVSIAHLTGIFVFLWLNFLIIAEMMEGEERRKAWDLELFCYSNMRDLLKSSSFFVCFPDIDTTFVLWQWIELRTGMKNRHSQTGNSIIQPGLFLVQKHIWIQEFAVKCMHWF